MNNSFLDDINLKGVINGAEIIVHGTISAISTYLVTGALAGRSFYIIGTLVAAGTSPATVALAAAAGTIAFIIFRDALEKAKPEGQPFVCLIATLLTGALVAKQIFPLTVFLGGVTILSNLIFNSINKTPGKIYIVRKQKVVNL